MLVPTIEREQAPPEQLHQVVQPTQQRRRRGVWLGAALLVVAVICSAAALAPADASTLVVRTRGGLTILDQTDGATIANVPAGQISPDGSAIASASVGSSGRMTEVVATSAVTGRPLWSRDISGVNHVRLVGHGGRLIVATPGKKPAGDLYAPASRTQTEFTVVRPRGSEKYSLWGNFEPEAVSLDGRSLFLVKYTPPMDPDSYQVRRLDLTTGEVVDVFTPDEELQQEMGGSARTHIASTDGRRLYTLYTLQHDDGTASAFVHVLSLDGIWAHCVDLPEDFTGAARSTALALSPAGDRLYVVDGIAGRVADVDTQSLRVTRTLSAPTVAEQEPVFAAADGSNVYVAAAGRVYTLAGEAGLMSDAYTASAHITALHAIRPGVVHLGVREGSEKRLDTVDLESKSVTETRPSPGSAAITGFGTTPAMLPIQRQDLQCAC